MSWPSHSLDLILHDYHVSGPLREGLCGHHYVDEDTEDCCATVAKQWERERESLLQSGNSWKETVEKDDFTLKITAEQQ
jgi:hypothetical protein